MNPVAPALTIANNSLAVNHDGSVALGIGETPFDTRDVVSVTIVGVYRERCDAVGGDEE